MSEKMNLTFINTSSRTLQELNDEEFTFRIPSFIILIFLMVFGVIGNGLVIYVFVWHLKKTFVQRFIGLLAIFDFGSCSIGVPLCLTVLRLPLIYPNDGLCKMSGFVIYCTSIASAFTLLVISIERYKKLCRPTKSFMSKTFIGCITIAISSSAAAIASPTLFIYKRIPITIAGSDGQGYECMQDLKNEFVVYYWGFLCVATISIIIVVLILYALMGKKLWKYYLHVRTRDASPDIPNYISTLSTSARRKLIQTTKITFSITFLFVVSFLPLMIYQIICKIFPKKEFSSEQKIYNHVLLNLWALNSSLNPFVYGFYCSYFRQEILRIFQPWKVESGRK